MHALQQIHLQENYSQPGMKDELPFGAPSLQDFHHIDQFHDVNGSSSNPTFGMQTPNFGTYDYEVYENKPFPEQNDCGHAHVMDNIQFQNQGYSLNLPQRNQLDMIVANQSYYMHFNTLETKS